MTLNDTSVRLPVFADGHSSGQAITALALIGAGAPRVLNHPSAALLRLPPVDALTLAWVMARRCDELDAWRALYEALHPAPAAVGQAQEASTP